MIAPEETVIKSVNIFRNGDSYFKGRKFIINCKKMKNFEVFLNEVTNQITPGFGAVRSLYTPTTGTKVNALDVLQNKESYVAAGTERFKKFGYLGIESNEQKPPVKRIDYTQIKPVEHSRLKVSAKFRKQPLERVTIFVYRNGDELYPGARVLLNKALLHNWESILETVTERVKLLTACVKLHKLEGEEVVGSEGLENFQYYVAVGRGDRFKKVSYGRPPEVGRSRKGITATSTAAESVQNEDPEGGRKAHSEPNSSRNVEKKPARRAKPPPPAGEGGEAIPTKPMKHTRKGPAKKEAEKQDQGNFKSKRRNSATQGAEEVDESEETKVDVHVDHREAEQVEEEVTEQEGSGDQQAKKTDSKPEQKAKTPLTPHPPTTPKESPNGKSESPNKGASRASQHEAAKEDSSEKPDPEAEPAPAEPLTTPAEEPRKTPTEEPRKTPTEEPRKTPAEEPRKTPAEEPRKTPTEEPRKTPVAAEPITTPADDSAEKPAEDQTGKEAPKEGGDSADASNSPPEDASAPQEDREATFVVG